MAVKISTTLKAKMCHLSLFFLAFMIAQSSQLNISDCGSGARRPAYNDISVECGTTSISLAIIYCPVMYTGYNWSELSLNHYYGSPGCFGTLDESVSPPVVRFNFSLKENTSCGSNFVTTSARGEGLFSDFSDIQTLNISGAVYSYDLSPDTVVTYKAELKYYYSCAYPLEYAINNTRVDVSGSTIAVTDKNGSFISTLSMELFSDVNYTTPLIIPSNGLELRTRIYVQVEATNLTEQYHVLLDRCYATISPDATTATDTPAFYELFVACQRKPKILMHDNGGSHQGRFSFEAFRFTQQANETVSTYYLHCITRLCEKDTCSTMAQNCTNTNGNTNKRRKRDLALSVKEEGLTESATLSSPPIVTSIENPYVYPSEKASHSSDAASSTGLKAAVGVLAVAGIVGIGMAAFFYRKLRRH